MVGGYTPDKVALRRAHQPGAPTSSARSASSAAARRSRRSRPSAPHTTGYDPTFKSENSDYDPARAKALLDLYGYVDRDGDGWRDLPDGKPLVIDALDRSPSS